MVKAKFFLALNLMLAGFSLLETTVKAQDTKSSDSDQNTSESGSSEHLLMSDGIRREPDAYFGFGASRVTEIGLWNHFEYIYGSKPNFVSFEAGYYVFSYGIDVGILSKISYAKLDGNPLQKSQSLAIPVSGDIPSDVALDKNQSLEMTLLPVHLRGEVAFSPFKSRRIVLRGWYGIEQLYVEEVLKPRLSSASTDADDTNYLHKGWNSGRVQGIALSVSLNGLEPRSDFALRSLGIDRTYISPYYEISKTQNNRLGNFDRKTYGISFTFESLR